MARYGTAQSTQLPAGVAVVQGAYALNDSDEPLGKVLSVEFPKYPSAQQWVMHNVDRSQDVEVHDLMVCDGLRRDLLQDWSTNNWKLTGKDRQVPIQTQRQLEAA